MPKGNIFMPEGRSHNQGNVVLKHLSTFTTMVWNCEEKNPTSSASIAKITKSPQNNSGKTFGHDNSVYVFMDPGTCNDFLLS